MRASSDPDMFGPVPQRIRTKPESERLYLAVIHLRAAGMRVFRAGRGTHLLNGRRVPTKVLLARAGQ